LIKKYDGLMLTTPPSRKKTIKQHSGLSVCAQDLDDTDF